MGENWGGGVGGKGFGSCRLAHAAKFAGWDMIVFEGRSPKPAYLYLENDKAELRDTAHLWGKSTWVTEEAIKAAHQDPQIRVSSIG
jgi:aldehyde:ferredoxin oxidoreductase